MQFCIRKLSNQKNYPKRKNYFEKNNLKNPVVQNELLLDDEFVLNISISRIFTQQKTKKAKTFSFFENVSFTKTLHALRRAAGKFKL